MLGFCRPFSLRRLVLGWQHPLVFIHSKKWSGSQTELHSFFFKSLDTVLSCFVSLSKTCWKQGTKTRTVRCFYITFLFSAVMRNSEYFSDCFFLELRASLLVVMTRSTCCVRAAGLPSLCSSDLFGGCRSLSTGLLYSEGLPINCIHQCIRVTVTSRRWLQKPWFEFPKVLDVT